MFTDLLKSKTTKPKSTKTKEEADKRVEELLEQLFTKSEDMSEDMSEEESAQVEESMSELDKGGAMPWRRKLQEAAKGLMTPTEEEANGAALKGSYEGEGEMMKAEEGEESMSEEEGEEMSEEEGEEMSEEKGDDRAAMLALARAEGLTPILDGERAILEPGVARAAFTEPEGLGGKEVVVDRASSDGRGAFRRGLPARGEDGGADPGRGASPFDVSVVTTALEQAAARAVR